MGAVRGQVLRIERSSIHDGPGLRTVVFLKGCPLRCQWCSTPESWRMEPQLGLERDKCIRCGACADLCPRRAVGLADGRVTVDRGRCTDCLRCAEACPTHALFAYGRTMSAEEVLEEIRRDEVFFFHSGGGVTLSGGEPLAQPEFAAAILARSRDSGINTALETGLYAREDALGSVLPWVDYLYVDIKRMDSAAHRALTGAPNEPILQGLQSLGAHGFRGRLTVRVPVIPSLNDSEENLLATARFCAGLEQAAAVELLPYHRLGLRAYDALGLDYPLRRLQAPDASRMRALERIISGAVPRVG